MIAVGLDWKMAIGACVLGNTIMGLVITINGRMGAIVGCVHFNGPSEAYFTSFIPRSPCFRACHSATTLATLSSCLAAFSLSSGWGQFVRSVTLSIREANLTQCPNYDWWTMHDCPAHSHLAKLCSYSQSHTRVPGYHHGRDVWLRALLLASTSLPVHPLHQGMALEPTLQLMDQLT